MRKRLKTVRVKTKVWIPLTFNESGKLCTCVGYIDDKLYAYESKEKAKYPPFWADAVVPGTLTYRLPVKAKRARKK